MAVFENIIKLIAPFRCIGCGVDGDLLCRSCYESELNPQPSVCYRCNKLTTNHKTCKSCRNHSKVYRMFIGFEYQGLAQELVRKLKFQRAQDGARLIAHYLDEVLPYVDWDCVTYIPTASKRIRSRGYDQSKLVAKHLSRRRNIPFEPLLARVDQSRQVGKRQKVRKLQAENAFQVKKSSNYKNILIIDDVMASGATMEAASQLLKESGIKRVDGAVFARS